ncbi:N-acetylmuramoyl-L-alanine amidase [Daejeonella lutea]|uniref:N-acetylmuramoyl-L-alanine amidase n=1 Tax=Daejeonella lutea TaxID=572036 RepID=A0A1T5DJD1_9SPHI|nr:N-acetylmuramoyl-L-alanine amidase [Daejeonella lutea]SKB71822.1 N-acetylmuramoyl-L-alanine amidase [Daejeonella lutea]
MISKIHLLMLAGVVTIVSACSSSPYSPTNKIYKKQAKELTKAITKTPVNPSGQDFVGTVNFGLRKPNYVIIHHTAQNSTQQTLKTFTVPTTQVSAHYVIGRDGMVYHMLNDYLRAWHGGVAKWGNATDINSSSIGIELDNNGFEPFSESQISSLLTVLDTLKKKHGVPTANFIGHSDIAPGRKVDPNVTFPWKKLAERGFGLWQDAAITDTVPATFNPVDGLRIIGYDVKNPVNAVKAFQLHFIQKEITGVLNEDEKKVLFNLYKKYL